MDAMMRIVWLHKASAALDKEYDYIFSQNPQAAKRVFERIIESTERLSTFPESGRPGQITGTRELIVPGLPYIVVYRITGDKVQILRVFHTSQDWPQAFH